jgi:hypothetical protein
MRNKLNSVRTSSHTNVRTNVHDRYVSDTYEYVQRKSAIFVYLLRYLLVILNALPHSAHRWWVGYSAFRY